MSERGEPDYPISVVVPTVAGWPAADFVLAGLMPQLRAARGQLVVADVSRAPVPASLADARDVLWLKTPGQWVTRARRAAYRRASGRIVALTEDHCTVSPDWVERTVKAHADNPRTLVITGAVENGTQAHLADWALYVMAHSSLAPPLGRERVPFGKTNVSYKREILAALPDQGAQSVEDIWHQQLEMQGVAIAFDDSIRVAHHQCSSLATLAALQFHNGRTVAGARGAAMASTDYLRALLPAPLAAYRTLRTARQALAKPLPRGVVVASLPLVGLLQVAHAVGEVIGYLRGAGDSPLQLH